jgi:cell division protein FtsL
MNRVAQRKKARAAEPRRSPIGRRPTHLDGNTFIAAATAAGLLAVIGVGHTWTRVAVLERKYQLARAQSENERLTRDLEKLSLETETLESAGRVDAAAHGVLAMAKPAPTNVVVIEAEPVAPRARATVAVNER